jgi:two-component system chemotaxis response regulator CheB/chemosensory pili system protein ChpB (putative protein-glutamate methylesterase)
MPDHATETLPRIALVFGEEATAAHVREAMAGHVDIVYASAAADFDAARLASAGAASALVNLDGGDWLDGVESALHAAGIAVVYNDPEISRSLDGWARARWLRHLVAKLRGSRDVDPPRPEAMSRATTTEPLAIVADAASPRVAVAADDSAFANAVEKTGAVAPAAVVELPLSPEEIETMTVDFVGAQVSAPAVEPLAEAAHDVPVPEVSQPDAAQMPTMENALAFEPALDAPTETLAVADESLDADASQQAPAGFDFEAEAALDVDTEALSAMIDARLAEPESAQNQDPTQVWREVSGGAVPPAQQDQVSEAEPMTQDTPIPEPIPAPAAAAAVDDADVLASLPSLDDWALVDPDVAPAAAASSGARKAPEPVLSEAFAGLELVPMETIVPLRVDADPIERWFGGDPGSKAGANDSIEPKMKEVSHEHG